MLGHGLGIGGGGAVSRSAPPWPFDDALLDIDFARNRARFNGVYSDVASLVTTPRASQAWAPNKANVWESYGSGVIRRNNRGVYAEEQRTNSVRNASMQGAVVGNPGTNPTYWGIGTPQNGLSKQIVGLSVVDGIDTMAVNFAGTTATTGRVNIDLENSTSIAASAGQVWTGSFWASLTVNSGATPSVLITIIALNGSGAEINRSEATIPATWGRNSVSHTMPTGTASILFRWNIIPTAATAYDFTMRLGGPQMELGAGATSFVRTAGSTATRYGDFLDSIDVGAGLTAATVFVEFEVDVLGTTANWISLDAGTANDRIFIYGGSSANFNVRNGGVDSMGQTVAVTLTKGTIHRAALAVTTNDGRGAVDGTLSGADGVVTWPSPRYLKIGWGGPSINSFVRRATVWGTRKSDAYIQERTRVAA